MLEEQSDRYLLYLLLFQGPHASLKRKVWFDGEHIDLQREELFDSDGRLEAVLSFEDHREVAGVRRPFRVTAREGERTVTLTFEEIEMNPSFGTEDFQLAESGARP
jgi:outer membrane lipoprotein-sorting protein